MQMLAFRAAGSPPRTPTLTCFGVTGVIFTGNGVAQRRDRLQDIITPVAGIRLAKEKGLEGFIAERKSSIYRPGKPRRIG